MQFTSKRPQRLRHRCQSPAHSTCLRRQYPKTKASHALLHVTAVMRYHRFTPSSLHHLGSLDCLPLVYSIGDRNKAAKLRVNFSPSLRYEHFLDGFRKVDDSLAAAYHFAGTAMLLPCRFGIGPSGGRLTCGCELLNKLARNRMLSLSKGSW